MFCNAAITIANFEGGKLACAHTQNRTFFKVLDFRRSCHICCTHCTCVPGPPWYQTCHVISDMPPTALSADYPAAKRWRDGSRDRTRGRGREGGREGGREKEGTTRPAKGQEMGDGRCETEKATR